MKFKSLPITIVPLFMLASASIGLAQNFGISGFEIAGGGAVSSNGQYALSGTIGQVDAGQPMTAGNYSITGGFWAEAEGAGVLPQPLLSITRSGSNVIISWPSAFSGSRLEAASDLNAGAVWTPVSQPAVQVGDEYCVTVPIIQARQLFRLVQ